jgi:hypothetical protein
MGRPEPHMTQAPEPMLGTVDYWPLTWPSAPHATQRRMCEWPRQPQGQVQRRSQPLQASSAVTLGLPRPRQALADGLAHHRSGLRGDLGRRRRHDLSIKGRCDRVNYGGETQSADT